MPGLSPFRSRVFKGCLGEEACEQLRRMLKIEPTHRGAREFLKRIEKE